MSTPLEIGRRKIGSILVLLALCLLLLGSVNTSHFPPWTAFHSEAPAFAASALLLLACAFGPDSRATAPFGLLALLVIAAWLQQSFGLVPYAGDAWVVTAYVLALAAGWLWASQASSAARRSEILELLHLVLILSGMLAAFQSLTQWFQAEASMGGWVFQAARTPRSVGNYGQPNQTATLLLMATASAVSLMVQGRVRRLVAWPLLLLLAWSVVLTQSRTALVSGALMAIAFFVLTRFDERLRKFSIDAALWLLILFGGSWLLQVADWPWSRSPLGAEAMASVGLRPIIWRQLLTALLEQPWFGYGWLQISSAQQHGALQVAGIEQANYAHNLLLDLLVMLGIPLGGATILAASYWMVRRARRLREAGSAAVAGLFILLPFLVHTQLELPHAYAYFLVPVGILLGLIDAATRHPSDAGLTLRPALVACLALCWVALMSALAFEYAKVEEDYRVNRFENRRLGETPPDYANPKFRMLTQFGEMLDAMRLRAGRGMDKDDLDKLVRASRRYTWAPLQFRTALALALNGRPEEATANLRVIRDLFSSEVFEEGRHNWRRLQQEEYPELAAVPYPSAR